MMFEMCHPQNNKDAVQVSCYYLVQNNKGPKLISKVEATSIALAKENRGIVASNNLSDIGDYVKEFSIEAYYYRKYSC